MALNDTTTITVICAPFYAVSPSIQPEEDTYIATEFQVQEVTCTALGVPPPTITFMMGGVVLDGLGNDSTGGDLNERVRLQNQSESLLTSERLFAVNRTLEIVSPVGSDTGSYTCLASFEVLNTTLTATATFDIIVQGIGKVFILSYSPQP